MDKNSTYIHMYIQLTIMFQHVQLGVVFQDLQLDNVNDNVSEQKMQARNKHGGHMLPIECQRLLNGN